MNCSYTQPLNHHAVPLPLNHTVVQPTGDLISKFAELTAQWVSRLASTLQSIFNDPGAWLVSLLESCYAIREFLVDPADHAWWLTKSMVRAVCNHPHLVCVISLCLFTGPVVVLLPFLLLHEIAILVLFNLNFVGHGLLPGALLPRSYNSIALS